MLRKLLRSNNDNDTDQIKIGILPPQGEMEFTHVSEKELNVILGDDRTTVQRAGSDKFSVCGVSQDYVESLIEPVKMIHGEER